MNGRIIIWRAAQRARRTHGLLARVSLESARMRWRGVHPDCYRARYARAA